MAQEQKVNNYPDPEADDGTEDWQSSNGKVEAPSSSSIWENQGYSPLDAMTGAEGLLFQAGSVESEDEEDDDDDEVAVGPPSVSKPPVVTNGGGHSRGAERRDPAAVCERVMGQAFRRLWGLKPVVVVVWQIADLLLAQMEADYWHTVNSQRGRQARPEGESEEEVAAASSSLSKLQVTAAASVGAGEEETAERPTVHESSETSDSSNQQQQESEAGREEEEGRRREAEEEAERRRLYMSEEDAAAVRRAMAGMSFPEHAIPAWAKRMDWKSSASVEQLLLRGGTIDATKTSKNSR